jgi:hypothetical protein
MDIASNSVPESNRLSFIFKNVIDEESVSPNSENFLSQNGAKVQKWDVAKMIGRSMLMVSYLRLIITIRSFRMWNFKATQKHFTLVYVVQLAKKSKTKKQRRICEYIERIMTNWKDCCRER